MHYGRLFRFLALLGIYIYLSPKDNPIDKVLAKKAKEVIQIVEQKVKGKEVVIIALMAPRLNVNNDLYVKEKGQATITTKNLNSFDKDSDDFAIIYQISKKPLYGDLYRGRKKLIIESTFTQQDLRAGRVKYVHRGRSILKDDFWFSLQDSDGRYADNANKLKPSSLNIFIDPINDRPLLVQNYGAKSKEQGGVRITANLLNTKDKDSLESQVIYTVVKIPQYGSLAKNKKRLTAGSQFTQNDITQGKIIYVHESDNNNIDQFKFTVQDSEKMFAKSANINNPASFFIDVTPVNDRPELLLARNSKVKEQGKILITEEYLKSTDIDNEDDEIQYVIVSTPKRGILSKDGIKLEKGSSFTQEELFDNAIVYSHDGSDSQVDGFKFSIKDAGNLFALNKNKRKIFNFKLSIIAINDRPKLQLNNNAVVTQYDRITLGEENLKARDTDNKSDEIVYKLLSAPLRGDLKLNNSILGTDDSFTQKDIDEGRIVYDHDDDNPSKDEFSFSVSDKDGEASIAASNDRPATFVFEVSKAELPDLPYAPVNGDFKQSVGLNVGFSGKGTTFRDADQIASEFSDIRQTSKEIGAWYRTLLFRSIATEIGLVQRRVKVELLGSTNDIKTETIKNNDFYMKLLTTNKRWNFGIGIGYKNYNFLNYRQNSGFQYISKNTPTVAFETSFSNVLPIYDFIFNLKVGSEFYKGSSVNDELIIGNSLKYHLGASLEKIINNYSLLPEVILTRQILETQDSLQTDNELLYKINVRYSL